MFWDDIVCIFVWGERKAKIEMAKFLDTLLSFLQYLLLPSFIIAIIGFILLFAVNYGNANTKKRTIIFGSLFAQVFLFALIFIGLRALLEVRIRSEIKEFLSQNNLKVKVNNNLLEGNQTAEIITDFKKVKWMMGHHSSPDKENKFIIELVSDKEIIKLVLMRDTQIDTEYWVFWDKYQMTEDSELGRIKTNKLKKTGD